MMNKKVYLAPQTRIKYIKANAILAGSTGATGEDIPWVGAKSGNSIFDDESDNEEE